ncbi:MAG: GHKL domain-containing protein [bacterium]|nr:GHKL domain-containing protein [bacterium]
MKPFLTIILIVLSLQLAALSTADAQNLFRGVLIGCSTDDNGIKSIVKIDSTGKRTTLYEHSPKDIFSVISNCELSPDGKKIAFSIAELVSVNNDVIKRLDLERLEEFDDIYDHGEFPRPVPDGNGFVFKSLNIWAINSDGTGLTQLTDPELLSFNQTMRWSPDSKKLVYTSYRPYGLARGEIWEYDLENMSESQVEIDIGEYAEGVTDLKTPEYSPDGRYIIFANSLPGNNYSGIFLKDIINDRVYYYFNQEFIFDYIEWSPLGDTILFSDSKNLRIFREDRTGQYAIGDYTESKVNVHFGNTEWSPDGSEIMVQETIDGKMSYVIYDRFLRNRIKELPDLGLAYMNWGGIPTHKFTGSVNVNAELIKYFDPVYLTIVSFSFCLAVFIFSFIMRYRAVSNFWIVLNILFPVIFIYTFRSEPGIMINGAFILTCFGAMSLGVHFGNAMKTELYQLRKDLLINLLKFGHSGTATKNLNQLEFISEKLTSERDDLYSRKRFIEYWSIFKLYTSLDIELLFRNAKKSRFIRESNYIRKNLLKIREIGRQTDPDILFRNTDFGKISGNLKELKSSITSLEMRNSIFFSSSISDMITAVLSSYENEINENGIEVSLSKKLEDTAIVFIDRQDLQFVVSNMIHNSIRAVIDSEIKTIRLELFEEPTRLYLRISDSGCGIEDKEKLFTPGFSGSESSGMGLFYSREILLQYRGKLELEESKTGEGSTFILSLRKIES